MADTANKPWTGPTSKDAHAGGKTLGKKLSSRGSLGNFTNGGEQAMAAFRKMKFGGVANSTVNISANVQGAMTSKPREK